ncbi:cytochrome P450 [Helicostylum pulchrum]|nr:cytochrome P450 [Helicostylum pulchrum]
MENIKENIMNRIQLSDFTEVYIPYLENNKKTVCSITAAISVTTLACYFYRKLTVPSKNLRNLPRITYIDLLKSIMKGEGIYERKKRLIIPLLDKAEGLYLEPSHVGWQLRSTNPKHSKLLLADMELTPKDEDIFGSGGSLICKFLGGKNVGTVEGEEWKRHRKITNPAFHNALPVNIFSRLTQKTFGMMEKMGLENLECSGFCERMTLDAIGLAGFDFDFETVTKLDNEWLDGYDKIRSRMTDLFFLLFQVFDDQLKWMFPGRVEAHNQLDKLLAMIDGMVADKRVTVTERFNSPDYESVPDAEKDFLTLMLEAEMQGEGKLSDLELRRNVVGFFFAGHDTTSTALAFAIAQLGRNKEIQEKARAEACSILGDELSDVLPGKEDIKQMTYIDAVIKETLRLNSPLSNTVLRTTTRDVVLGDYIIPQGTHIDVDIVGTHMSENNWDNALEFNPERYLNQTDATSTKDGLKWTPFGYGSHQCPGINFSYAEQKVFLSMLLRKFEWELPQDTIHRDGCIAGGYGSIKPVDIRVDFKKRY